MTSAEQEVFLIRFNHRLMSLLEIYNFDVKGHLQKMDENMKELNFKRSKNIFFSFYFRYFFKYFTSMIENQQIQHFGVISFLKNARKYETFKFENFKQEKI